MLDLNFLSGALPEGVTFARASSGTYFDSSGVMQTASSNVARFDHDPATHTATGLLYEPQRQNIEPYSLVMPITSSLEVTYVSTTTPFIDGMNTANEVTENATEQRHYVYAATASFYNATTYTASLYLKAGSAYIMQLIVNGSILSPSSTVNINLTTQTVTWSAGSISNVVIEDIGNGWRRVALTFMTTSGGPNYGLGILFTGNNPTAVRLPYYAATGDNVFMSGLQIEASPVATSYIKTTGSAVTRAADQLGFTIPNGVSTIRYTFDDGSMQDVAVEAGVYQVPTTLNRLHIKRIHSV